MRLTLTIRGHRRHRGFVPQSIYLWARESPLKSGERINQFWGLVGPVTPPHADLLEYSGLHKSLYRLTRRRE